MRTRRSTRTAAAAAILLAAGGLTACGSDGTADAEGGGDPAQDRAVAVYEEFADITGAERETKLLDAAVEAGGQITVYTSNSAIDAIIEGFEDTYPDLTVNTYRATPETFLQRFFQEQEAGYYGVDVVEDADVTLVTGAGLAGEYVNEDLTAQMRGLDEVQGQFIPTRAGAFVVAWNTDLVDESEIPDTLEGFADPKWAGQLSMADADWPWYMTLSELMVADGKSQEEVDELFTTLGSYSTIVPSHTLQAQLLAAGEYGVALTAFNHSIDLAAADGAPVTWKRSDGSAVEPVVFHLEGAVPVINAPNPAGALLFIDYMLTGGQEIMANMFRPTSIPQGGEDLFAGIDTQFVDIDAYLNEREEWEPKYLEFMNAGSPAQG